MERSPGSSGVSAYTVGSDAAQLLTFAASSRNYKPETRLTGTSRYPGKEFYVPDHPEYNGGALAGSGLQGYWGTERGLTFYQVQLAGHELPGYTAGAGYRSIELLLGRIKSLSDPGSFTTQSGNFTGSTAMYHL